MNSDLKEMKKTCMVDFLAKHGYTHIKSRGNDLWYLSPLHEEHTPSFKVNLGLNTWYDFGLGKGGTILDFIMETRKISTKEAVSYLTDYVDNSTLTPIVALSRTSTPPPANEIKILQTTELTNSLLAYLQERGIPNKIAKQYCKQVQYHFSNTSEKTYFAVGFENDKGGFELRSPFFKGANNKDISTLGDAAVEAPKSCLVFEGFMDFLSYMTKPLTDLKMEAVVLNSVINLNKGIDYLKGRGYSEIYACLDNDKAGKTALNLLKQIGTSEKPVKVIDLSTQYIQYKDLNESLCKQIIVNKPIKKGLKI